MAKSKHELQTNVLDSGKKVFRKTRFIGRGNVVKLAGYSPQNEFKSSLFIKQTIRRDYPIIETKG
jgi:hypothetical protein